ncbi:MAG: metallophosphoesterase [Thermovirgaceae bacterium]|nr:metallophosphoesterase [Thermovirgaceae bacterium]
MKFSSLFSFLGIALSIYAAANLYIWIHLARVIPYLGSLRIPVLVGFWLLVAAFPLGRIGGTIFRCRFTDTLAVLGSWYMAAMIMALLMLGLLDILLVADQWLRIFPDSLARRPEMARLVFFWVIVSLTVIFVAAGRWNAIHPVLREYEITLRGTPQDAPVRVVVATDLHVGLMVKNHWLGRMIEVINSASPDVVLLVGDTVDSDATHAQEERLSDELALISAPLGVYAVLGNHEFYSGAQEAVNSYEAGGVRVLRDECVVIGDAFTLLGRDDRVSPRMGLNRLPLAEIPGVNGGLPVIVMDHTPSHLGEAEKAGVALQVSGHTHRGQLWPFNYITAHIFEQDWGFLKKGKTLYYISCGVGVWGPPIRTSSRPEVVVLKIRFEP